MKTHKESIEAFTKAGRLELAAKEQEELTLLAVFLPKELSDDELQSIVSVVVKETDGLEFGPRMGKVMAAVKGQAGRSSICNAS